MADYLEKRLIAWGEAAEDDNDLRTGEGIRANAERYSARRKISLSEALEFVRSEVEMRQTAETGPSAIVRAS